MHQVRAFLVILPLNSELPAQCRTLVTNNGVPTRHQFGLPLMFIITVIITVLSYFDIYILKNITNPI
jgi:hypothetical protein